MAHAGCFTSAMAWQTRRLTLSPLDISDAPGLFAALDHPEVGQFIGGPAVTTLEALRVRIQQLISGPPPGSTDQQWLDFTVRSSGARGPDHRTDPGHCPRRMGRGCMGPGPGVLGAGLRDRGRRLAGGSPRQDPRRGRGVGHRGPSESPVDRAATSARIRRAGTPLPSGPRIARGRRPRVRARRLTRHGIRIRRALGSGSPTRHPAARAGTRGPCPTSAVRPGRGSRGRSRRPG